MRRQAILVVCLFAATAVIADDGDNVIRGGGFYSIPTGDVSSGGFEFEPDSANGPFIAYERKFTELIGLNFDIGYVKWDVDIEGGGLSGTFARQKAKPLSLALLFHPFKNEDVDFYVGPAVSYVLYDDARVTSRFQSLFGAKKIRVDNDFAGAAQVGLDILLGETWGLNLDAKYIHTSSAVIVPREGEDLDINPVNLGVGFSARF